MCALIIFVIPLENVLGFAGYMIMLLIFVFYCSLWPFIFYDKTKKRIKIQYISLNRIHDASFRLLLGGSTAQYRVTLLWIAASVDNVSLYHLVHFISAALLYAQKKERGKRRIDDRFLYGSTVDNSLG